MDEMLKVLEDHLKIHRDNCDWWKRTQCSGGSPRIKYDTQILAEQQTVVDALTRAIAIIKAVQGSVSADTNTLLQVLELETKASKPPWSVDEGETPEGIRYCHIEGWTDRGITECDGEWLALKREDADLIAATRNPIRPLIEEVLRQRAIIKAARDVVPALEKVCCLLAAREAVKMLEGDVALYNAHHETRKELDTFLEAMKGVG